MTSWVDRLAHKLPSAERGKYLRQRMDDEQCDLVKDLLQENIYLLGRYEGMSPETQDIIKARTNLYKAFTNGWVEKERGV